MKAFKRIIIFAVFVFFIPFATAKSKTVNYKKPLLKVYFIDVGQGDSELIITPGGTVILIDAGPGRSEWSNWDAGEKVVVPLLKSKGIKKIDYVVMSHAHLDHCGGLIPVLKNFKVKNFVDPGLDYPSYVYEELLDMVSSKKINYIEACAGDRPKWDKDCEILILNPPKKLFKAGSEANENSIVLKLTYKKISFLFTGDAEKRAERFMAKKFKKELLTTVLKVAHHGSHTSSTQTFLDWSMPIISVIEVGAHNRWGHPHKDILKRLKDYGCRILRTDKDGTIEIITDGINYEVKFPDKEDVNYGEGYE